MGSNEFPMNSNGLRVLILSNPPLYFSLAVKGQEAQFSETKANMSPKILLLVVKALTLGNT